MKTINIGNFEIDVHDGPICLYMSGGVESSLLCYILIKYAPGPIHIVSVGNGTTNNQEPINSLKVINFCMKKLGRREVYFHSHWVEYKTIYSVLLDEFFNYPVSYFGLTRPPPEGSIVDFDREGMIAVGGIDHKKILPHYWTEENLALLNSTLKVNFSKDGYNAYTPFVNINKREIAKLYKNLEIEDLYPVTRSCESLTLTTGHCGKCWWCKERIWGFGYLD
jgi:hypothetical protein